MANASTLTSTVDTTANAGREPECMGEGVIHKNHFVVAQPRELDVFDRREFAERQPGAPDKRPHKADDKGNEGGQYERLASSV